MRSPLFASLTVSLQRVSGPGEAGSTEIVSMVIEGASWATVAPPSARPLMLMAKIRRSMRRLRREKVRVLRLNDSMIR